MVRLVSTIPALGGRSCRIRGNSTGISKWWARCLGSKWLQLLMDAITIIRCRCRSVRPVGISLVRFTKPWRQFVLICSLSRVDLYYLWSAIQAQGRARCFRHWFMDRSHCNLLNKKRWLILSKKFLLVILKLERVNNLVFRTLFSKKKQTQWLVTSLALMISPRNIFNCRAS